MAAWLDGFCVLSKVIKPCSHTIIQQTTNQNYETQTALIAVDRRRFAGL